MQYYGTVLSIIVYNSATLIDNTRLLEYFRKYRFYFLTTTLIRMRRAIREQNSKSK